jgi:hypothetical protein
MPILAVAERQVAVLVAHPATAATGGLQHVFLIIL